MLRHAQAINDGRAIGLRIHRCSLNKIIRIDTANLRHLFGRIVGNHGCEFLEAFSTIFDEFLIGEPLGNNGMGHAVGERHVGAGRSFRWISALLASPISRGSTTISFAPRSTA